MKKILVTGANGQLGKELQAIHKDFKDFTFQFCTRSQLDIINVKMVQDIFSRENIDYCINCAAYTAVDKVEEEPELAYEINANGLENLAKVCRENDTTLIHISTDFVFDGKKSSPYTEVDKTNPLSIYGKSKLKGEQAALANNPKTIIIRTSWLYSSHGHNFVKTMMRLASERDELKVVNDQIGSPTYAGDLAEAIVRIITKLEKEPSDDVFGIYHYSNEGVASWYDFAVAIVELSGYRPKVLPIPSEEFPTPAVRPAYSVLDKGKIKEVFGVEMAYWRESLRQTLKKI